MSLHRRTTHLEYVEGCFGCKISELELSVGAANHRGIPTAKQHDRELQSYYDATRQGIEPRSTKSKDIDAAVQLSNDAGKAFDGISMTFKEQGDKMPKVGMKEFSYGPKGMKAAKMEAKKTGKPMKKAAAKKKTMKKMGKKK